MTDEFDFTDFDGDYFVPNGCDISNMEIMQFTGLNDKNGKDIWEGDICKMIIEIKNRKYEKIAEVQWMQQQTELQSRSEFQFRTDITDIFIDGVTEDMVVRRYIEVIGNIYEDPELLNQ